MPKIYTHLTTQERAVVMTMRDDQCSIRSIATRLGRAPSSISRELRRAPGSSIYDANLAHLKAGERRVAPRRVPKLTPMAHYFRSYAIT
jgi:IS30 family transposase